jgi:enamine deaminase RidA (YjgF/YER057c/UK114 family)
MNQAPGAFRHMTGDIAAKSHQDSSGSGPGSPDGLTEISTPSTTVIQLGGVLRLALMITPEPARTLADEIDAILAVTHRLQRQHESPLFFTTQTVFLRDAADERLCRERFAASPGHQVAITHYSVQPPANGARLAVEAWAVSGPGVLVEKLSPQATMVCYDGLRWLYTGDVQAANPGMNVHAETLETFQRTSALLAAAGMNWQNVVRTWWHLGGITDVNLDGIQRYKELNRARAEVFNEIHFGSPRMRVSPQRPAYPASTGIGMAGRGLSLATLALQTRRPDVALLPLENPLQTPAYNYAARYSPQSPKFSRAMALLNPDYMTLWISGTASIVDSEVRHPGNAVAQTEQTLDNISELISSQNLTRHGQPGAGATLRDLAKVRVYVKRPEDVAACREVCGRRLGDTPAIYVIADVCRPELLVEIEGVAFTRLSKGPRI